MRPTFTLVDTPNYRLLSVTGDIDGATAPDLGLACMSSLPVIVDLLQCPYMDSSGLNVLMARSRTNTIALVLKPACRIYRIFAITGLLERFVIGSTLAEVVSVVAAPVVQRTFARQMAAQ